MVVLKFLSPSWDNPIWSTPSKIRQLAQRFPTPLRRAVLLAGWLVTPHRIPARLRIRNQHRRSGVQAWLTNAHSARTPFSLGDLIAPSPQIAPLSVFSIGRGLRPRILMVTDSLAPSSFFGGVGTATLFAAQLANQRGAGLGLVTLAEDPYGSNLKEFFDLHCVQPPPHVEFRRVSLKEADRPLDVGSEDLFVTTSWWSTRRILGSIAANRIIYVLQEDERMFYPAGDEQLQAQETMSEPGLRVLVNSRLLYDHMINTGCPFLRERGTWFEPAFPQRIYFFEPGDRSPLNFFFYARPNNARNLFSRGIAAINKAFTTGILRPKDWRFHFVGKDLRPLKIAGGSLIETAQRLSWNHYAALIRRMDLGLSLMHTPHPSYPPLDLAASGAVAVTNAFASKTSLSAYSENIICADLSVDGLVEGLAKGAELARNSELRLKNYHTQGLSRSWEESFAPPLSWLDGA